MKMATHYQQCTPMIYKSSLPSHSAKQCVHLSCSGSTLLYFNHFRSLDMSAQGQGDQVCVQSYLGNSLRTIGFFFKDRHYMLLICGLVAQSLCTDSPLMP
nr:hypothetical protein BgiMline_032126 [Biomphalaria glabrata]